MKVFGFLIFLIIGGSEMMESAADAPITKVPLSDNRFGEYLASLGFTYMQTFSNQAGILCDVDYPVVMFPTQVKFDVDNGAFKLRCVIFGVKFQQADFDNCMNRAEAQRGAIFLIEAINCLVDIHSYE